MATFDPQRPSGGQQGIPQAQPLPQATPVAPTQPAQAQPATGQPKPTPQPEPRAPQAQPVPQAAPVAQPTTPTAQPTAPVAQPTAPVAQPTAPVTQPTPQAQPTKPTPQPVQPGQPTGKGPQPIIAQPTAVAGSKPAGMTLRTGDEDAEEAEEDITSVAVRNAPPWLISAAIHMVILIVLGLIFLPQLFSNNVDILVTTAEEDEDDIWAEELGQQLEVEDMHEMVEDPVDSLALADLPEVPDPLAAPQFEPILPDSELTAPSVDTRIIGMALDGRQEGSKRGLIGAYGGTKKTEDAVMAGLLWLARNQLKNGSWSLAGPYTDGIAREFDNPQAATAMALLAFQGAGNTTKEGRFRRNVAMGWKWLLAEQDDNGNFFHEGSHNHRFYTQGQCAIAICELYAMTKDKRYKDPAERAIKYCLDSQSQELGGWRYDPGGGSDVSVTGWIVMALQSARMAGIEVPEDNLKRVERFLDRAARNEGSRYPYQVNESATLTMTAEAMLMRQYLGWAQDDPRLVAGMEWVTAENNLIDYSDINVYAWYYATQAAHHMEGDYWKRWNNVMRQEVPEHQVEKGRETGSWNPGNDKWAVHAGRLYSTCLSIYMLEVYYRHLPIYSNVYGVLEGAGDGDGTTSVLKR